MKFNLKTAVIGVGNMGKQHARVYSQIAELVAVADLSSFAGKAIADKYQVKWYRDYLKMLEVEKLDAVSIATPNRLHKDIAIECLRRKIPTLVEKPIADSIISANQMLKESKENKTFLMVGHIERFNPAVIKLKKLIENEVIGKIISLLAIRVGINPPNTPKSDVAVDLGIHDVDVFNFLLNEYPRKKTVVRSKIYNGNIADSSSILLEYRATTGLVQTNWITPVKMRKLYVTGTKGFVELDYVRQKLVLYIKIIKKRLTDNFLSLLSLSKTPKKEIYISKKEPLKQELIFFLENIKNYHLNQLSQSAVDALEILL